MAQERAEKLGYSAETHEATTEDGYILQLFRITGSKKSPKAENKPAVLLLHGLLDCSASWLLATPEKSLGYLLADWGYDVWLGNARGSRYSRKHKWMTTQDKEYWTFSWHEIGIYDLPAMIDHIREASKQEKILYVGHSQGTTAFFVMASERVEQQAKIKAMFALAPATFMPRNTNPFIRLLAPFADNIGKLADLIGMYEFMPTDELMQSLAQLVCGNEAITKPLCEKMIVHFIGANERDLNLDLIPEVLRYDPAGASTRQFVHYAQLINSGKFQQYNHGLIDNLKKYGTISPPDYKLQNIEIPIYLHYSSNDEFVHTLDLRTLYRNLPNAQKFLVPDRWFTHIDFLWSNHVDTMVYNKVLGLMERHRF
ncbi:lipase 3-like [Andrena cerasifolii]|uniref:lipase 3-like n=1 Tax=Andrena cerasifolii TaxID=2819439 RepID=UPI004037B096